MQKKKKKKTSRKYYIVSAFLYTNIRNQEIESRKTKKFARASSNTQNKY